MRDALNFLTTTSGQALTTAVVSEQDINLAAADSQVGLSGRQLYVHILVTVAAGGMASGARFELVDDSVTIATGTARVILASDLLTAANLAAGAHIVFPIPPGKLQQYFGWMFTPVSEAATGLTVVSWIDDVAPADLTVVT